MKKITEAELSNRVNSLREKLVLENNSAVDEAWYDPSSWGKPDYKATDAVKGKNSQRNYNAALAQIKSLYAAAGVAYPPQDKIVQQRFGLPDPLPATAAEWDGTMPNAGQADYLTRNVFGRDGSAKAGDVNTANNAASVKQAAHDTLVDSKVEELKQATNSLLALIGNGDVKPSGSGSGFQITKTAPLEERMKRLLRLIKEAEDPNPRAVVTPGTGARPVGNVDVTGKPPEPYNAAKDSQTANPSDKAGLIKQCQALMTEINKLEEDPDQDIQEVLRVAQAAIDQANKEPEADPANPNDMDGVDKAAADNSEANQKLLRDRETLAPGTVGSEVHDDGGTYAVDANGMCTFKIENGKWVPVNPPIPAVTPELQGGTGEVKPVQNPAQDKYGNHIPIPSDQTVTPPAPINRDAMPFGQAFADARAKGEKTFPWKGKEYSTKREGEDPAFDDALKKLKPATTPKPATPPAATPTKPSQYQYLTNKPKDVPPEDRARLGLKETVSYADDQTLARIVSLSRR